MSGNILSQYPYITLTVAAILLNIPLGYLRENCPKFSFKWFFWIHASIPLIIYLRVSLNISKWFIPISIFLAVVGQIVGGRWRKKYMSLEDQERLQQVSFLDDSVHKQIDDSDVMVTLLNMGGPKTNADVKDFQKRLFSDSRLIRFPLSWMLQKLFAALLIAFRSKKAEKRYQLIGGGESNF